MVPWSFTILLTKITAAENEVALSYHSVLGLYFMAVVFEAKLSNLFTGGTTLTLLLFIAIQWTTSILASR